jgi:sugar phosphate isomerase/epimerase
MHLLLGDAALAVGCCSWSFACLSLERSMRIIRALGFGHLDIGFAHLAVHDPESPRRQGGRMRKRLQREGLTASDLFPLLPFETNDPDALHRSENARMFRRVVEFAAGCQAPGITLKPGVAQPSQPDGGWRSSVETLRQLAAAAKQEGVQLSVEPHVDSIIEAPEAARRLVECVPEVGLTLDYSHFVSRGLEVREVEQLHPYVRHVHIRQARQGRLQTTARNGSIPLRPILEQLAACGYRGAICLEYQNSDWHDCNDIDVLSETVATLRELGLGPPG